MAFFVHAEGEAAILVKAGAYKTCNLYTRDGYLFAQYGGAFLRLMHDGSTTGKGVRVDFMTWAGPLNRNRFGYLCTSEALGIDAPVDIVQARFMRALR